MENVGKSPKKLAFVTGATSGIGEATAIRFALEGYNLIIAARREDRLIKLRSELEKKGAEVLIITMDVRKNEEVKSKLSGLSDNWKNIDVLVNNAGLASGLSTIDEGNTEDWDVMIDTNVKGLLYVSRAVIPFMVRRKKGHIINIGSIAGKETYLKGNVYCATKHAVDSLTKGMRIDLLPHHIKVTGIHPGAVETEFSLVRYKGDVEKAQAVYKGFQPLNAGDVADAIFYAASRPAHVTINDMIVMPTAQANPVHLLKEL